MDATSQSPGQSANSPLDMGQAQGSSLARHQPDSAWRVSLRVAGIYLAASTAWILWSDELAARYAKNSELLQAVQNAKGLFFVTASSALILWLVYRHAHRFLSAQSALAEEEARFRHLYHGLPIPYHSLDGEAKIIEVNEAWLNMLRYSRAEVIGRPISDFIDASQVPVLKERFARFKADGEMKAAEYLFRRKNGTAFWAAVDGRIGRNSAGHFQQTHCVLHDLTQRKRAEEVMQARWRLMQFANTHTTEQLLQATLDEAEALTGSLIGFYHYLEADQQTLSLQVWSTRTAQTFCKAEGKGRHYNVNEAGVWVDCVRKRRPVIHNDYASLPHRKGLPPGHATVVRELALPVFRNDRIVAILGVGNKPQDYTQDDIQVVSMLADLAWDISERMQAEQKLRDSELLYQSLVDHLPLALFRVDREGRLTFVNHRYCQSVGLTKESILTKTDFDLFPRELAEKYWADDQQVMDTGAVLELVERHASADGKESYVRVLKSPLRDAQGQIVGVQGLFWDATERQQAEDALRRSEANLATAQRIAHIGSWETELIDLEDSSRNTLWWSDETYRIFGYEPGAVPVTYALFSAAVVPEDRERVRKAVREAIEKRHRYEIEHRIQRPDGTQRVVQEYAEVVWDEQTGRPRRLIGTVQDVTERKQAETALVEERLRFQHLFENSPVATWFEDLTALEAWMSRLKADGVADLRAHLRVHPESLQQAVGLIQVLDLNQAAVIQNAAKDKSHLLQSLPELFTEDTYDDFITELEALWQGRTSFEYESHGRRLDGRPLTVLVRMDIPHRNGIRDFSRTVITGTDITARKQAEAELREQERFISTVAANSPDHIVVFDLERQRPVYLNRSLSELLGYTREETAVIQDRTLFHLLHPDDAIRWRTHMAQMTRVTDGAVVSFEYRLRRRSGDYSWFLTRDTPFRRNAGGLVVQVLGVAQDITERRESEQTRARLEAQLRQAQKMEAVGQLAGGVAHDFNNLLTVIIGNTSLLFECPELGSETQELVRQIATSADRAANLTRQLLTFSRRQVMQVHPINLNEVLGNIYKMLSRLLGEHIALQCNYAPDLPLVEGDTGMLEQVIVNLAVNARDAMPRGGRLTLSTATEEIGTETLQRNPEASMGRHVSLTVADNGCGMDASTLARIFEPFFTTKDVGKGTGLGLATVYGIVKQHNGWIEVASQLGEGTSFKVYLPTLARPIPAKIETAQCSPLIGGTETVLLVEDDYPLREMASACLRRLGYRVMQASTGIEALQVWKEAAGEVDLLLTDMVMPEGMNGRELAEQLRLSKPDLKVIFSSGYSNEVLDGQLGMARGDRYLPKPYDPPTLAALVRERLDNGA